jgi:nucleoside-diphosphate-sugar epimerase
MNKILITGAGGFIGNRLAHRLANNGECVHVLIRDQRAIGHLQHPNIKIFVGDINHADSLAAAISGCTKVFHLAGVAKLWSKDSEVFYQTNVRGTETVLKQALKAGVKKLVYTSSAAVYGPSVKNPICENDPRIVSFSSDYELSKHLAECIVKEYVHKGLFTVIVNPTRVYGPGHISHSNAISRMLLKCLNGERILIPECEHIKGNYAFVDDVVEGHIQAMSRGLGGEKYILGGSNISYGELVTIIQEQIKVKKIAISSSLMKAWSWIELIKSRILNQDPIATPSTIGRYLINAEFDCQKAVKQLGYAITPFHIGIRQTIEYLKNNE